MKPELQKRLLVFQKNEITEYHIYQRLAAWLERKSSANAEILRRIALDEKRHYAIWQGHTEVDVRPRRWQVFKYYWLSRLLGFTFGIKLMERNEDSAHDTYSALADRIGEAKGIAEDENRHEDELIELLDEERLQYTGSMVLGLNDALVELTGALAGFTLALQDTKLIAVTGLITGIAAALSMAASEYLSTKSEETEKSPLKASLYTGVAYIGTVFVLIAPYLVLPNYYVCLLLALIAAVVIIFLFNFYISVAKDLNFKRRFFEMAGLSLGVALVSFGIGFVMRIFLGVDA